MKPVIQVNGLDKFFSDIHAVNNISFTVNEGDVYGFLGQNGAGKSTTIRMLLTLVKPSSGEIRLFGLDLKHHRHEILSQVGAVIEKPDMYRYLTAYDNLSIFARLSGIKAKRTILMDQLDRVGLADRAHSKVKTYSQGMKQRLGIAVALIHDPKLIILDEPTNGLDPQGIADMRNLIISLSRDQGKTVVVSSHLLSEIEQMATRMIIIHKGKKMVEGVVAELLDPDKTLVQICTTNDELALQKIQESKWHSLIKPGDGVLLNIARTDIPELTRNLVEMNLELTGIIPQHSLENYFLSLTNQTGDVAAFAN